MRTTFEITAQGLGSQNAVCGGGRYDGLVELLGEEPGIALVAERVGAQGDRLVAPPLEGLAVPFDENEARVEPALEAFRWLLEELKVSLFAQELRTPFPVSYKRLERAWTDLIRR